MNAAPIDIPPSLLSYVVARSMPDFHRSLFPRERKKGGKEKEKIVKFFKAGGEGKDVPNFLDEVRYLVVDNDSRSLAFSSRRIERLAKIEEAFCSIFARWNIDAEDQRKRRSKKTKHVSVSWNVRGGIEAGGQSLQRIRIAH